MLGLNLKIIFTFLWLTLSFSVISLHAQENYRTPAKLDLPSLDDNELFPESSTLRIALNEQKPLAENNKEPLASDNKEPLATQNEQPLATQNAEPSAVHDEEQNREINAPTEEEIARREKEEQKAALMQQVLLKIYRSNLLKKTYKHVIYPESSIQSNEEGEVILIVNVDRNGKVLDVDYESRTPSKALNRAAKNAVKRAKPFNAAPDALVGEQFAIRMPIRFRLTN